MGTAASKVPLHTPQVLPNDAKTAATLPCMMGRMRLFHGGAGEGVRVPLPDLPCSTLPVAAAAKGLAASHHQAIECQVMSSLMLYKAKVAGGGIS